VAAHARRSQDALDGHAQKEKPALWFSGRTSPRLGLDETVPLAELGRLLATECEKSTEACVDEIVIEVGGGTFRELAELARAVVRAPDLASRRIPLAFETPKPKSTEADSGDDPPKAKKARIRLGALSVGGPLSNEIVEKVVRDGEPAFRRCYERGLATNPNLQGRVSARFVIGRDGSVYNTMNGGSDLPDSGVVSCVLLAYGRLRFPKPDKTIATVVSPVMFTPD
jgi:hypothetical protein